MDTLSLLPAGPLPAPPLAGCAGGAVPGPLVRALAARGVGLEPAPEEEPERHGQRLETALMAVFRDERLDAAFEALYARTQRGLTAWIVHLLALRGQGGDPAELLQDTFVNVYRYARGFREGDGNTFRGWARTIAANVVRRARVRRGLALSELPGPAVEPEDERPDPARAAVAVEQRRELHRAWTLLLLHYAQAYAKLSPRDRQALHLVEVEGLTYAEAGRRLRVGPSNMKMIMFRSRKRIRAHMLRAMGGERAEERRERALRAAG